MGDRQDQKQRDQLQWVQAILTSAQSRGWYGKITIEVKRGVVDLVRCEETLKDGQLGLHAPHSQV